MLDEALWLKGEGGWIELFILGVNRGDTGTACYKMFEMEAPVRVRDEWYVIWDAPLYHLPDEVFPADTVTEKQLREFIITKYILMRGEGDADGTQVG